MARVRSRNWCFTLNNYTKPEKLAVDLLNCTYIVYGEEQGESGTPHLQGYVEFANPKDMSSIKKAISDRLHLEKRKGTAKQAADYCKKDGHFVERGEMTQQGRRTDLETAADMVKEGAPLRQIAEELPTTFIKYNRGIEALRYQLQRPRNREDPPTVTWLWGKTGTGKTRFPHDFHNDNVYIKDDTIWWDGYDQQEAIIIDDYEPRTNRCEFRQLLRLLDRYEYQGQRKGGYVKINSPYIYITSSYPPEHFWNGDDLDQIKRRLSHTFEFA